MGKVNNEAEEKTVFKHFSHEHPLQLTSFLESNQTCFGCSRRIIPNKPYYTCKTCDFSLHSMCYDMPRKIRHPADPDHDLILFHFDSFQCKACEDPSFGFGFSYYCRICHYNYHSFCALLPLSESHYSHPHPLKLEFSPPYDGEKAFRCDICNNLGFDHWLYHCRACDFAAHLKCAKSKRNPQAQTTGSLQPAFEAYTGTAGSSMGSLQSRSIATNFNQGSNISNGVQPNGNQRSISMTDQAGFYRPNGLAPVTVSRSPSTNTMGSSMATSQFMPNANGVLPNGNSVNAVSAFGTNQTGFVQPNNYPNGVQPNGPYVNPMGTHGTNQAVLVQPNNYPNGVQPNGPYVNPMGTHGTHQAVPVQPNYYPHGVQSTYGTNPACFVRPNGVPMVFPQTNQAFGYGNQMGVGSNKGSMSGMKGLVVGSVITGAGQALGQEMFQGLANGLVDGSDSGGSDTVSSWIGGSDIY